MFQNTFEKTTKYSANLSFTTETKLVLETVALKGCIEGKKIFC